MMRLTKYGIDTSDPNAMQADMVYLRKFRTGSREQQGLGLMTRRKTHDVMSSQTGADSSEPETAATKQMQGFQGSLVADSSFLVIQFGSKLSKLETQTLLFSTSNTAAVWRHL
jgi:hypothetical protein